jgi:hypothetical protein
MTTRTWRLGVALGVLLGLAVLVPGQAQYPYPPGPPPPYPYWGQGGYGPGNVLNGNANVMDASGSLMVQQEQARILREKAQQAKLTTKKATLDWKNYERANTPSLTEEQERSKNLLLRRMLSVPSDAEITTGKAFNVIMPFLQYLSANGIQGPPVFLNPAQLKDINVTVGSASSVGALKDPGPLRWPLSLLGPAQKKLDSQVSTLTAQARKGDVDPALYAKVKAGIEGLHKELNSKYFKGETVDVGAWVSGKRFLESLAKSVGALSRPDASRFLKGDYAAKGRTVDELVANMMSKGLRFAAATPGQEAAYYALYSAFTTYAAAAQNSSGFRVQVPPSRMPASVPGP